MRWLSRSTPRCASSASTCAGTGGPRRCSVLESRCKGNFASSLTTANFASALLSRPGASTTGAGAADGARFAAMSQLRSMATTSSRSDSSASSQDMVGQTESATRQARRGSNANISRSLATAHRAAKLRQWALWPRSSPKRESGKATPGRPPVGWKSTRNKSLTVSSTTTLPPIATSSPAAALLAPLFDGEEDAELTARANAARNSGTA
mmetsp:Transcript_112748/g.364128  ORF Transcript_112748/g.364128 Transcript_112748/m.364128 type:complete len:209 (-) Transcript_112748:1563-2189(-)